MPDLPPLTARVDWIARIATMTVRGRPEELNRSQVRDCLDWIAESRPRRLMLDLRQAAESTSGQFGSLIMTVRRHLPAGCLLDVRPAKLADQAQVCRRLAESTTRRH